MTVGEWAVLIGSLFDQSNGKGFQLPGSCIGEWLLLVQSDYDEVDRFYIDNEVIGA